MAAGASAAALAGLVCEHAAAGRVIEAVALVCAPSTKAARRLGDGNGGGSSSAGGSIRAAQRSSYSRVADVLTQGTFALPEVLLDVLRFVGVGETVLLHGLLGAWSSANPSGNRPDCASVHAADNAARAHAANMFVDLHGLAGHELGRHMGTYGPRLVVVFVDDNAARGTTAAAMLLAAAAAGVRLAAPSVLGGMGGVATATVPATHVVALEALVPAALDVGLRVRSAAVMGVGAAAVAAAPAPWLPALAGVPYSEEPKRAWNEEAGVSSGR